MVGKENKSSKKEEKDVYTGLMPKKALTGYTIYFQDNVSAYTDKGIKVSEAMKDISKKWMALSEKDKAPYQKKNEEDKKRMQKQLDDIEKKGYFILDDGSKSCDHSPKKKKGEAKEKEKKDKAAPKRPSTGYIFFTSENAKKFAEEKQIAYTEAMKECGKVWNSLDDKAKAKYERLADEDKVRFERQNAEYLKKGYYVMADGAKSSILNTTGKSSKSRKSKVVKPERSRKSSSKSKGKDVKEVKKGKKAALQDLGEDISD